MTQDWVIFFGAGVLDAATILLLVLAAAFTSFLTAAVGIGGGVMLLAIMASLVPLVALVPLHALVQVGSNGNRALMTRAHADWSMFQYFAGGAVLGAVLASFVVVQLPVIWIQLCVALFILYLVWTKTRQTSAEPPGAVGGRSIDHANLRICWGDRAVGGGLCASTGLRQTADHRDVCQLYDLSAPDQSAGVCLNRVWLLVLVAVGAADDRWWGCGDLAGAEVVASNPRRAL